MVTPLSNGGVPAMTYTTSTTSTGNPSGGGATSRTNLISGTDYAANILAANSTSVPAQTAGRTYVSAPLSTYSAPFNTTLGSNTGAVTWTFIMRTNRTTALSGFGGSAYVSVVILAAASSNFMTANGYGVMMIKGTTTNAVSLIRFANGLGATPTTIIGPSPDIANNVNFVSVKVVYTPSTNTWQLYVRDDASSSVKGDPSTVTTQVGTNTINSTYTGTAMTDFGFFWNHSAAGSYLSSTSFYDDFTVTVTPVLSSSLSVAPSSLTGFTYIEGSGPSVSQSYSLSGVNLTGFPGNITVTGSTNYEISTDNINFGSAAVVPYTSATLNSTPVYVRLKAGLIPGNYNLENIVNAGGGAITPMNVTCSGYIMGLPKTYIWTGATDNNWTGASNWSPNRTSPAINDVLQFSNGNTYTITNVPTQTIAQMAVSGGSKITLQAAATTILTIAGIAGDDFTVSGSGTELNISGSFGLTISLISGTNGLISGSMNFSGGVHAIKSADANSLVFANGGIFKATTGFTGNAFGTANLNSVKFQSGSTYIQDAGSNPFGAAIPNSVLTFETGSLYKFTAPSGGPSYSGRTYANLENDSPLSTQNNQGSNPITCDNYIVTSGIVNWDFTAAVIIKGNISVASGATVTFGNATKLTNLSLNGAAAQTISGTGNLIFGANGVITVNNSAGIILARDVAANNLTFQNGIISTGTNTLSVAANAVISGAGAGKYIFGKLQLNFLPAAPSTTFAIGDAATYTPVTIDFFGITTPGTLTANTTPGLHPNVATSGLNAAKCVNRFWTITSSGLSFASYDATFTFVPADLLGGANPDNFIVKKWDPSTWSSTTISDRTSTTTKITGVASFSDFQIGEFPCDSPLPFTVTGGGAYCSGGTGLPVGIAGSETGVNYQLYIGATTPVGLPVAGTGSAISFGNQLAGGTYSVKGIRTIGGCSTTMTGTVTIIVNPVLPVSVSIAAAPSGAICAGTSVTFTATPVNGGVPSYQWKLNNVNVGSNLATYTSSTLTNNDKVACVMTSGETCQSGGPATSNEITILVNPLLPVSVSITASPLGAICPGTSVTYAATTVNGGTTPAYQWKVNGTNAGSNTATFITTTLVNNDVVSCVVTSNAVCPSGNPATSNEITMTVGISVPCSVTIAANPSGTICTGSGVTFAATPYNGGSNPQYQWKVNGTEKSGATNSTYIYVPVNGESVTCVMTSSSTCANNSPTTSNAITMSVSPPSVGGSVTGGANVCYGFNSTVLSLSGQTGSVTKWQSSTNGSTWIDITCVTNTYTAINLTATSQFRAVVQSSPCSSANSGTTTITVSPPFKITGFAKYDNNPKTPLNGLKITLKQGGVTVGTPVYTSNTGAYTINGLTSGTYNIEVSSADPSGQWQTWNGVNNTDYLLVARHVSGVTLLPVEPPVIKVAASVKAPHPGIENADAEAIRLAAKYGWGSPTPYFDIPKWVFSGITTSLPITGIVLNCADVVRDIRGLCAGDVNGSYLPPNGNKQTTAALELIHEGGVAIANEILFPVRAGMDMELGAMTLFLDYDASQIEILNVSMPREGYEEPYFITRNNTVQIGWASLTPEQFTNGETVLLIHSRLKTANPGTIRFTLNDNPMSELADSEGNVYENAKLKIADAGTGVARSANAISVYPNPAKDVLHIEFLMEESGTFQAELQNLQGALIISLDKTSKPLGLNNAALNLTNVPSGSYILKVECGNNIIIRKIIVNK
ncbi:MAG: T9SS type A sorting domain-containing protein [Bacteroidota bacterium]